MEKNKIISLMNEIKYQYGNDAYVGVTNDKYFREVPTTIKRHWYSLDELSISTLDTYYHRMFDASYPTYTEGKFLSEIIDLRNALSREFSKLEAKSYSSDLDIILGSKRTVYASYRHKMHFTV